MIILPMKSRIMASIIYDLQIKYSKVINTTAVHLESNVWNHDVCTASIQ